MGRKTISLKINSARCLVRLMESAVASAAASVFSKLVSLTCMARHRLFINHKEQRTVEEKLAVVAVVLVDPVETSS